MVRVVVPFRAFEPKSRLSLGSAEDRAELALAMLRDTCSAAEAVGRVVLATGEGGLGSAVAAELERLPDEPVLVLMGDLPCATPRDLFALVGNAPPGGMALVEGSDGGTNALALASPRLFAPLYGPGSAARFRAHAERLGVACVTADIPNLVDDVDTPEDLSTVTGRVGPHTKAALASLQVFVA
jgi:2-phospho-L-lactate guanylyltransferase (CobY/MobA/RfbA family)